MSSGESTLLNPLELNSSTLTLLEPVLIAFVTLTCITFLVGTKRNLGKARAISAALTDVLQNEFASIGIEKDGGKHLMRDGPMEYWYHASGRVNTSFLNVMISLAPRSDFLKFILRQFKKMPYQDRITFYLPIDKMNSMSILLLHKDEINVWKDKDDGVALNLAKNLAGEVQAGKESGLGDDFIAMAEHKDLIAGLLKSHLGKEIWALLDCLQFLHVSDAEMPWDEMCKSGKNMLRMQIGLPNDDEERAEKIAAATKLVLAFADTVQYIERSSQAVKKVDQLRKSLKEKTEKEEMAERRLQNIAEKEKKANEAAGSKMSREKKIILEEKQRKKEYKKKLKKAAKAM